MSTSQLSSHSLHILGLISEAALLIKGGKVAYMNDAARQFLGDVTGKNLKALFGPEVANIQASSFITGVKVAGQRYILRMSKSRGESVLFLTPQESPPTILNEPFLCSLRSDLMAISISVDSIRTAAEDIGNKDISYCAAAITRHQHRLIRLTNNASLVLNAADRTQFSGECTVNLSHLFGSMTEAAAYFFPKINFISDFGQDITCSGNPDQLRQLFTNLLSNCLVHAKGLTQIRLGLIDSAESAILYCSDDGIGIESDRLHTVFDRFNHSFELSNMNSGPGLGMSVIRTIAEEHGGTVLLESRPEHGTTVRVSFSHRPRPSMSLYAPHDGGENYLNDILVGLSDCLPVECYTEKYMD